MKNHAVEQPSVEQPSAEQPSAEQPPVTVAYLLGSLRMGGAEKHVTCLLEGLDKTRYRPLLFLTHKPGPYLPRIEKLGIPVRETGVRSVFTVAGFRGIHRLSKVMRQEDVRIVHS